MKSKKQNFMRLETDNSLSIDLSRIPFESEAKGDTLIGVHQTKTVKKWKDTYSFNSCVVLGIKWLWEYFNTRKEAKGLDNRYCVKFMQFGIGLLSATIWKEILCCWSHGISIEPFQEGNYIAQCSAKSTRCKHLGRTDTGQSVPLPNKSDIGQQPTKLLYNILTHLLAFGSPQGSPNTSKIHESVTRYLAEKCLITYKYGPQQDIV